MDGDTGQSYGGAALKGVWPSSWTLTKGIISLCPLEEIEEGRRGRRARRKK